MTDDDLDDVQPKKLAWLYDEEARTLRHRETWNAAIEAALYEIDDSELYYAVARLKK